MLIADLCTGFLLLVQFRAAPTWSMLLLSAAYFYSGAMALLHILTFPGAWIADTVLIGTSQSVGWLFISWLLGLSRRSSSRRSSPRLSAKGAGSQPTVSVSGSNGVLAVLCRYRMRSP